MRRIFVSMAVLFALLTPARAGIIFVPMFIPVQVPNANTGEYARIHKVAIISAIGETLSLQNHHFIGTKSKEMDISDWKLDDMVGATIRQYLGKRWSFQDVPYDRHALAAIPNGQLDNSTTALRRYLSVLARSDIDAFIVLRPDLGYGAPGSSGLAVEHGNGLSDTLPTIWANYEIKLIDARDLSTIASAYSRVRLREGAPDSYAGLIVDDDIAIGDTMVVSDRQTAKLQSYFRKLVDISLIETLRSLQLGVDLPAPGARVLVPIPPDKLPFKAVKSVAVVSGIGETLDVDRVMTVFSQTNDKADISDWGLDARIEQDAGRVLAGRFTVKPIAVDRKAFAAARLLNSDKKFAPEFPGLTPSNDVDAYVVFVKLAGEASDMASLSLTGLGVSANLGAAQYHIFANYAVAVLNAQTLKIMAIGAGRTSPKIPENARAVIPDALWPGHPPALTPDRVAGLKPRFENLLDDSVDETLLALGLTGMMPSDALPPADSAPPH